jgi:hypothetical protein
MHLFTLRHIEHIELPSNRTALDDFNLRTEPNFKPNFLSTRSNRTALGRLFGSISSIANTDCRHGGYSVEISHQKNNAQHSNKNTGNCVSIQKHYTETYLGFQFLKV